MLLVTTGAEYGLLNCKDADGFAQLLTLYQGAIEASEQKSADELAAMLHNPRYKMLVARDGQSVIAFAIVYFPACGSFWLLEYMAVDPGRRSQGLGERTFQAAKRLAAGIVAGAPCVLEVDQPDGNAPADVASRRLRFYGRLGCRRIEGLSYILPMEKAGTPPPMWLLVHGIEDRDTLSVGEVGQWLQALYVEVYEQPSDDRRIFTMLSCLNDLAVMRLIALA
ncbi:MAG: GNAT family N-acetyltransferase [Hyphomicrobium sp.]|jgi:GNAT superfamily N-acetyltransferase